MPLHEPKKTKPKMYCGPTAVCAITGANQTKVERIIHRSRRSRKPIIGTVFHELHEAFRLLGWNIRRNALPYCEKPLTFHRWARSFRRNDTIYLVNITGHWVAVHGRRACDYGGLVQIDQYHRRRSYVKAAYPVVKS